MTTLTKIPFVFVLAFLLNNLYSQIPPLPVSISVNPSEERICEGQIISFTAAITRGYSFVEGQPIVWTVDGLVVQSSTSPIYAPWVAYSKNKRIEVSAQVINNSTQATTTVSGSLVSLLIEIIPYPISTITTVPSPIGVLCSTCSASLEATDGSNYTYTWYLNNSEILGATNRIYEARDAGEYQVKVTAGGICTTRLNASVTVFRNSAPLADAGVDKIFLSTENTIVLYGVGSDIDGHVVSYSWRQISGPTATLSNKNTSALSVSNYAVGDYVFGLTVTDEFGEQSLEDKVNITVSLPPINNYNWIKETSVLVKGMQHENSVKNALVQNSEKSVTWNYFDGLGRPMQSIQLQNSPAGNDIVVPIVYDSYGRESTKYIPVPVPETNGYYKKTEDIIDASTNNYKGIAANVYSDTRPFSETQFESSPLNRSVKEFGPGEDWKADNKGVEIKTISNVHNTEKSLTGEMIVAWEFSAGALLRASAVTGIIESGGYYSTGQLTINSIKDEHGYEIREYTNKEGKVILKKNQVDAFVDDLNSRAQWASTYYIYDEFGYLVMVLPPEAVNELLRSN